MYLNEYLIFKINQENEIHKIWYPPNAHYLRNYFQECCIKELNVHNVCSCPIKLKGKHQCFISLFAITMFYCILSYFKCNVKCNSRNGLRGSHWLSWLFLDCTCNNYTGNNKAILLTAQVGALLWEWYLRSNPGRCGSEVIVILEPFAFHILYMINPPINV